MKRWFVQRPLAFNTAELLLFPPGYNRQSDTCLVFDAHVDVSALAMELQSDCNLVDSNWSNHPLGLAAFDMDSTLICIECIDEIADFAGVKLQVAEITERAMQGELDFGQALRARVALLKGLPLSTLKRVYDERLRLNPGVADLLRYLHARACPSMVVSGGFTYFVDRLAKEHGMTYAHANTLGCVNDSLTGTLDGAIVDSTAKQAFLNKYRRAGSLTLAVGDGANDLPMLKAADIAVAFHAKPKVREQCHLQLNYCGMDAIIPWLTAQ